MVEPRAMLGFVGETCISDSVAAVTVSVVLPEVVPDAADITVEPGASEVASPLLPLVLPIVAKAVFDEFQVTDEVKSWLEPSE